MGGSQSRAASAAREKEEMANKDFEERLVRNPPLTRFIDGLMGLIMDPLDEHEFTPLPESPRSGPDFDPDDTFVDAPMPTTTRQEREMKTNGRKATPGRARSKRSAASKWKDERRGQYLAEEQLESLPHGREDGQSKLLNDPTDDSSEENQSSNHNVNEEPERPVDGGRSIPNNYEKGDYSASDTTDGTLNLSSSKNGDKPPSNHSPRYFAEVHLPPFMQHVGDNGMMKRMQESVSLDVPLIPKITNEALRNPQSCGKGDSKPSDRCSADVSPLHLTFSKKPVIACTFQNNNNSVNDPSSDPLQQNVVKGVEGQKINVKEGGLNIILKEDTKRDLICSHENTGIKQANHVAVRASGIHRRQSGNQGLTALDKKRIEMFTVERRKDNSVLASVGSNESSVCHTKQRSKKLEVVQNQSISNEPLLAHPSPMVPHQDLLYPNKVTKKTVNTSTLQAELSDVKVRNIQQPSLEEDPTAAGNALSDKEVNSGGFRALGISDNKIRMDKTLGKCKDVRKVRVVDVGQERKPHKSLSTIRVDARKELERIQKWLDAQERGERVNSTEISNKVRGDTGSLKESTTNGTSETTEVRNRIHCQNKTESELFPFHTDKAEEARKEIECIQTWIAAAERGERFNFTEMLNKAREEENGLSSKSASRATLKFKELRTPVASLENMENKPPLPFKKHQSHTRGTTEQGKKEIECIRKWLDAAQRGELLNFTEMFSKLKGETERRTELATHAKSETDEVRQHIAYPDEIEKNPLHGSLSDKSFSKSVGVSGKSMDPSTATKTTMPNLLQCEESTQASKHATILKDEEKRKGGTLSRLLSRNVLRRKASHRVANMSDGQGKHVEASIPLKVHMKPVVIPSSNTITLLKKDTNSGTRKVDTSSATTMTSSPLQLFPATGRTQARVQKKKLIAKSATALSKPVLSLLSQIRVKFVFFEKLADCGRIQTDPFAINMIKEENEARRDVYWQSLEMSLMRPMAPSRVFEAMIIHNDNRMDLNWEVTRKIAPVMCSAIAQGMKTAKLPESTLVSLFAENLTFWERKRPNVLFNRDFYPRRLLQPYFNKVGSDIELSAESYHVHGLQQIPVFVDCEELKRNMNGAKAKKSEIFPEDKVKEIGENNHGCKRKERKTVQTEGLNVPHPFRSSRQGPNATSELTKTCSQHPTRESSNQLRNAACDRNDPTEDAKEDDSNVSEDQGVAKKVTNLRGYKGNGNFDIASDQDLNTLIKDDAHKNGNPGSKDTEVKCDTKRANNGKSRAKDDTSHVEDRSQAAKETSSTAKDEHSLNKVAKLITKEAKDNAKLVRTGDHLAESCTSMAENDASSINNGTLMDYDSEDKTRTARTVIPKGISPVEKGDTTGIEYASSITKDGATKAINYPPIPQNYITAVKDCHLKVKDASPIVNDTNAVAINGNQNVKDGCLNTKNEASTVKSSTQTVKDGASKTKQTSSTARDCTPKAKNVNLNGKDVCTMTDRNLLAKDNTPLAKHDTSNFTNDSALIKDSSQSAKVGNPQVQETSLPTKYDILMANAVTPVARDDTSISKHGTRKPKEAPTVAKDVSSSNKKEKTNQAVPIEGDSRVKLSRGPGRRKIEGRGPRIVGDMRRIVHCPRRRRTDTPTTQWKIKFCLGCGDTRQPNGEPLIKCATCDEAFFCCTKCQRDTRKAHRETCKGVKRHYCRHW